MSSPFIESRNARKYKGDFEIKNRRKMCETYNFVVMINLSMSLLLSPGSSEIKTVYT